MEGPLPGPGNSGSCQGVCQPSGCCSKLPGAVAVAGYGWGGICLSVGGESSWLLLPHRSLGEGGTGGRRPTGGLAYVGKPESVAQGKALSVGFPWEGSLESPPGLSFIQLAP